MIQKKPKIMNKTVWVIKELRTGICLEFRIWDLRFIVDAHYQWNVEGTKTSHSKDQSLRPTSDRVKESIFNILQDELEGKIVLDLFAGTGNLGIEALSRGAQKTIFVEKGRQALRLIERNLNQFGLKERSEILPKDVNRAIGFLKQKGESFDFYPRRILLMKRG